MAGSFTPAASIPKDKQAHQSIYNKMITFVSKPFKTTDMTQQNAIKIFEERKVRTVWDSDNPRRYWSDLKRKLSKEGSQLYAEILQLKILSSDGKYYKTDVATTEQLFRLIQSIPSPKAEPASLLRSLRSLSRLKLASLKQQTLRVLTAVSALNAHQLRPEIEPDGSLGMADTACFFEIAHQVKQASCRSLSFAVCFSRRKVIVPALPVPLWILTPLNTIDKRD